MKKKIVRITTVPISLEKLLEGQLRYMNRYYHVIAVSSDLEKLKNIKEREGVDIYEISLTRKIDLLSDVRALFQMFFFLKKEKPFIVHTHTPKAGLIGMLGAFFAGVPVRLHTVAGLPLMEATGFKRKVLNFVEKITYACATKVYPNSRGLKEFIIQNKFCKASKLEVIANGSSNGINTSFFNSELIKENDIIQLKQKLKISEIDFLYIFVGRLVKDKGINELVEAFKEVNSLYFNTKLLLVGPYEHEMDPLNNETIMEIDSNSDIISVGYQNDVRPYLAIADVLTLPSYREGFPNVVMQAGAMGLPSIVTDINGCNEIVEHEKNGWIIPVKNVQVLKIEMINCMNKKESYNFAKSNARKMIVERYDQKVVWETLLEEYKRLEQDV